MNGGGADRIVNFDAIEEDNRKDYKDTRDCADQQRALNGDIGASAGNAYQACKASVDGHAKIRLSEV